MSEYEKLLRDYVKIAGVCESITHLQTKNDLKDFLDTYFTDVICEYSINNKMSLEEIIGYQLLTNFCYCRKEDFKELLNGFLGDFE